MAGNGASPITSSWLQGNGSGIGAGQLYGRIAFEDTNTNEGTVWTTWFFGTTGSSFNQTITVACSTAVSMTRAATKTLAVACTSAAALVKQAGKRILVACTSSVAAISAIKVKIQIIVVACTSATTLKRAIAHTIIVACTSALTFLKRVNKTIAFTRATATSVFASTAGIIHTLTLSISSGTLVDLSTNFLKAAKIKLVVVTLAAWSAIVELKRRQ